MASFTRFTACCGLSAHTSFTAFLSRSRTHWATTLGLGMFFASTVLASQSNELPAPTAFADIRLPGLDRAPQPTTMPEMPHRPELEEGLLIDTRTRRWEEGRWMSLHPEEHELKKRTATASISESIAIIVPAADPTTLTTSTTSTTSGATTTTVSSSPTSIESPAETTSPSPLPTFFDGGMSNTFDSESCPTFINDMIAAPDFQTCYPFSMLLGPGSTSFYEAEKSLVSISRVLDHSCAANVTYCANYLATVASNLTKSANCGDDFAAGQATATAAYLGLVGYQVVYSATCLKDAATQSYCFGDTITNTTHASEAYFYFLPLNTSLPAATTPLCGECLQDTMSIYHVATANRRQPIADTYGGAAAKVDATCGSGFANVTLADAIVTSGTLAGARGGGPSWVLFLTTTLVVAASGLF